MSQELHGLVPDLEDEHVFDHGTTAMVQGEIIDELMPLEGELVEISSSNDLRVELKLNIRSALTIYKNRDKFVFKQIKIIHRDETLSFGDMLKISGIKIKDVNHANQICTLGLTLVS